MTQASDLFINIEKAISEAVQFYGPIRVVGHLSKQTTEILELTIENADQHLAHEERRELQARGVRAS